MLISSKFDRAITNFHNKVIGADIAVVFYAGHGIEIDHENYMIPLGVKGIYTRRDLSKLIKLSDLIAEAKIAKNFGVLFVDACRDNPLQNSIDPTIRSTVSRGLGQVNDTPSNILVSFATKAGRTTADGEGSNSPYTQALKSFIGENDDIRFVIGKVRDWVVTKTKNSQQPQEPTMFGTLGGVRYCLSGACTNQAQPEPQVRIVERIVYRDRPQQVVTPEIVLVQPIVSTRQSTHSTKGITTINGKMWQDEPKNKTMKLNWNDAMKYCEDLKLGGYSDWRLPSKEVLLNLYKHKDKLKNVTSNFYWSSTATVWLLPEAWNVNFYNGNDVQDSKTYELYIHCVREEQ